MGDAGDVRWMQRYAKYRKALGRLRFAVELAQNRKLSHLEEEGLIKAFEFTFELAWTTIKDYYVAQGEAGLQGSRDVFRVAYQRGLITGGESWMNMIESRVLAVHSYNEEAAREIATKVIEEYYPLFVQLHEALNEHYDDPQGSLFNQDRQ